MIKRTYYCKKESFFKDDGFYDTVVVETVKIVLFGITIYHKDETFINDFDNKEEEDKKIGFKKK